MQCEDLTTGQIVLDELGIAATFGKRLGGLLGRQNLNHGEGLLITPCNAVHMMFMRFPIDVVFIDRNGMVVKVLANLAPWRISSIVRGACAVLEIPAGWAAKVGIAEGHRLVWHD